MKVIAADLLEEKRKYKDFDNSRILGPFVSRVINTQRTKYRNWGLSISVNKLRLLGGSMLCIFQ